MEEQQKVERSDLVTAARRTWAVKIWPIAGLRGPDMKLLIVRAVSEQTAKLSAWNKAKKGAYAHRGYRMWHMEIQEIANELAG